MRSVIIALFCLAFSGSAAAEQEIKIYAELSPPYQILGPDGKLTGLSVELVHEIQKRIGNKAPIEIVPWARGYLKVQNEPNTLLFTVARSKERNDMFKWIGPLAESDFYFVARADSTLVVRSLNEAKKLKGIGVYKDDVRDQFLTKAGFTNLYRSTENEANVKKTASGLLDVFISSRNGLPTLVKAAGFAEKDFREIFPFLKIQVYIAASKATPDGIVTTWSDALESMKKDGTFERIYKKYFPTIPLPGQTITHFD